MHHSDAIDAEEVDPDVISSPSPDDFASADSSYLDSNNNDDDDDDDNKDESESDSGPRDVCFGAWVMFLLMGVGLLFPWNAILQATDFFLTQFPCSAIEFDLSVSYMASVLLTMALALVLMHFCPQFTALQRVAVGFFAMLASLLIYAAAGETIGYFPAGQLFSCSLLLSCCSCCSSSLLLSLALSGSLLLSLAVSCSLSLAFLIPLLSCCSC